MEIFHYPSVNASVYMMTIKQSKKSPQTSAILQIQSNSECDRINRFLGDAKMKWLKRKKYI